MNTNMTTALLFFILLGVAWLIWPPLIILIFGGFILKYWYGSRVDVIPLGGYHDPTKYENPKDLLKCEICNVHFHKDQFQEHVLQSAIKEQELINEMPFFSAMLAKNRHKDYFSKSIEQIRKASGKIKFDDDDDLGKMFGDALNKMADKEMEKLTPEQRAEAEKFGEEFSEEFKKLSPSDQEKAWNSFADALREQKSKEWHDKWDKKFKEMGVEEGLEKKKRK